MGVAQLDRAFGYGPKGREFESSHPRFKKASKQGGLSILLLVRKCQIGHEIGHEVAKAFKIAVFDRLLSSEEESSTLIGIALFFVFKYK